MLAPYARVEETLIVVVGGAVTVGCALWLGGWAIVPAVLSLAFLAFYRDPPRRVPVDARALIAPADGKVMRVDRNWRAAPTDPPQLRIVIFLSVLDVHMNRVPCGGRVLSSVHRPGLFLNALRDDATLKNENNLLTLDPDAPLPGPIGVRQIAGLLAKRIVCAVAPGATLKQGERFGMIKLGSQTELLAPEGDWDVPVQVGDAVRGGVTCMARWKAQ